MREIANLGVVFGALALGLSGACANEPATVETLSPSQAAMYLQGAAEALGVMNRALQMQGRPGLFCPPADFSLTAAALYELADSKLAGAFPAFLFSVAGLDALQERYPCPLN